jgi:Trk K+ transport system NAD-binding subunit
MDTWQRRTGAYLLGLVGLMVVFAVAYNWGMQTFEGETQPLYRSFQHVIETFTATGYGAEAPWQSPEMNALVIVMDLVGVLSIFLALPVLLFPLFEEALSTTVPTAVDDREDHVIICTLSARGEALISELESRGVPYVVVEPDRETATAHYEDGLRVVNADPQSVSGLRAANIAAARAIVADASDDVNTSVLLTAAEVAEEVQAVSVVNEPDRMRYHELAGADDVVSPRTLLGKQLATKVTAGVSTDLGESIELGEEFQIAEFLIHRGSDLVGTTLARSALRETTGANVIGAWYRGQFETPPSPEAELEAGTVLLATGREDQLAALRDLTLSDARSVGRGKTVVAGFGQVGEAIVGVLDTADIPYTVLDRRDRDGVDVVGDATEPAAIERADIGDARTVILALPDDTATEVATLVARDLEPEVEIVARAEAAENIRKTYRAGADYVLSLGQVSGRMLASTILDETVVSPDTQVEVLRTTAPDLAGETLGGADVRSRTGCTVVAVEREGRIRTDLGPDFRIAAGDELIVAGTDPGINRFRELLE